MISKYWLSIKNSNNPPKFLLSKILIRLKISKFFKIKLKHYKLRFYPTPLSRELWIDSEYLQKSFQTRVDIFWAYLKSGDKFIDIGSHIGTVTLEAAAKVGTTGKIFSIEAHPRIFSYLQGNILLNNFQNINVLNFAIGNKNGTIQFSDLRTDPSNAVMINQKGISIPIKKLDELPIKENKIHMMKLYVVGYEKFALLGAENILKITDCVHLTAYKNLYEKFGYSCQDVFNILLEHDFALFIICKGQKITPIPQNFVPNNQDILATKDVDSFLQRSGYKLE